MSDLIMNRRTAITSLLAISAAGALAACGPTERAIATPDGTDMDYASVTKFFSAEEMAFLSAMAGTIIPQTETAGAVEAGVPDVLQDLASVWGDSGHRRYWREGIISLQAALQSSEGEGFAAMAMPMRETVLSAFDADVFDNRVSHQFYRDMKATVIRAYYTSEVGATEELAYEPVPGEWIGCVPLSEFPKAWAT